MRPQRGIRLHLVALVLMSLVVSGCGSQGSGDAAREPGTAQASVVDPVCDSVETLFARMRVDAARSRWSPEVQPFDKIMAARVRNLALQLATEQRKAHSDDVRVQIKQNMEALDGLGEAMGGHDAEEVLAAVRRMRIAYDPLKGVCRIDGASPPTAAELKAAQEAPKLTRRPPRSAVCKATDEITAKMRTVSAAWSPKDHPFDRATAKRTRELGQDLAALANTAKPEPVDVAIRDSAAMLEGIATAMDSRNRSAVYTAIGSAQVAYANLLNACNAP